MMIMVTLMNKEPTDSIARFKKIITIHIINVIREKE